MGTNRKLTLVIIAGFMLLFAGVQSAVAAGTASGTTISNLATVNYQVGGVSQTPIESSPTGNSTPGVGNGTNTTFVVDTKLDMTVAWQDGAAVQVTPGGTGYVLTFQVTNDGNATQDFSLSTVARAAGDTLAGVTDNFDASSVNVYVEDGTTAGYQAAQDTATYIDELAADASATVYVVASIPAGQSDGDGAIYDLVAQVAVGGSTGSQGADITTDDSGSADDPATVQTVFADSAGTASGDAVDDGKASDAGVYEVVAAALNVTKTASVISDPVNGLTNPKAIPGARIEYTITVDNSSGSATATSVTVTDSIPANTVFVVGSVGGGDSVSYSDDNGATWTYTPSGTTDSSVTDIQIVFNSIAAGGSDSATFRVEVQ